MSNNNEYADIQKLLAELPEVTLPDSLRADALFAKMDAQAAAPVAATTPATTKNKIIDITRRLRPVLSYAAVFAVLVLVYYGAGVDRMATAPAPAAAPEAFMMAADTAGDRAEAPASSSSAVQSSAAAVEATEATNEAAAAPQMAMNSPPAAAPRAMAAEAELPINELDFGELRATIRQLDNAVTVEIARVSNPSAILRTVTQDGSYTYMGKVGSDDAPRLLVATITPTNPQPTNTDNLHSYPGTGNDCYMVLTVLDGIGSEADATATVYGSNLILQVVSENNFVVFSDAKQDAATVDTIKLGSATIEMR